MQHSKQTGSNLKRKITATLLSLAIVGTSAAPLVSTVVANAASAEEDSVVGARLPHSDNDGIFWANATYFDYYSDNERANGWRNNIQAGTGFNGSEDNWFPFYQFNQKISSIADSNSAWSTPLYFGNLLPNTIPGQTGDAALPYILEHPDADIITSGGTAAPDRMSEAESMKQYLIEQGVRADRIHTETQSSDTEENLRFTADLIRKNHLRPDIVLVTSDFHSYRSARYAKQNQLLVSSISAPTPWWVLPTCWIREMYAILDAWTVHQE